MDKGVEGVSTQTKGKLLYPLSHYKTELYSGRGDSGVKSKTLLSRGVKSLTLPSREVMPTALLYPESLTRGVKIKDFI